MRIFEYASDGHLKVIPDHGFKKEKDLENLVAQNLDRIFPGLEWVQNQFSVGNRIIDILAYDPRRRMFVIIECKKKDAEMATQVAVYDRMVTNNKSKCELALVKKNPSLNNIKFNWSKVPKIFVKSCFTKNEIEAFLQIDDVILCEVRAFSDGLIVNQFGQEPERRPIGHVKRPQTHSTRTASANAPKQYSEVDWLDSKRSGNPLPETRDLYFELKNEILHKFPKLKHVQTKAYSAFRIEGGKVVCTVLCRKRHLTLRYKTNKPDSLPENDFVKFAHIRGHGHYSSQLRQQSDISRALEYVEMTYRLLLGKEPERRRQRDNSTDRPSQRSESDWLAGKYGGPKIPESTQNLYFDLKNAIREAFPQIKHTQTKLYAKFHLEGGKAVFTVECFKHKLDLVYATNNVGLLPINDFVEDVSKVGHHGPGKHRSQLRQQSDISQALEYVELTYRQQNAGRITKVNKGAGKQNDRSLDTNTDSLLRRAGASIDIVLQDGKEHKTQEIRNHLHNALENEGIVIHALKITNAVNSKLHSLKNAGKITNVGRGAYKRA